MNKLNKLNKSIFAVLLISVMALTGCGNGASDESAGIQPVPELVGTPIEEVVEAPVEEVAEEMDAAKEDIQEAEPTEEVQEEAATQEEVIPPNSYRSELTGQWIDESLMNQRPIAVMVDNEVYALDHYGVNSADIVYEMMNSTANGRITRLMCIVKDYAALTRFGSVRSTRPTNFMVAAEYNAILIHDGGPYYNDEYYAKDYVNNFSGGFARFSNGKATEFTEYVTWENYYNAEKGKNYDGLSTRLKNSKYDIEYNSYYPGKHFNFCETEDYTLSNTAAGATCAQAATLVAFPFPHNGSELRYNEELKKYEYYEYGRPHVDPLDNNATTSFKNVIIQDCDFTQLDVNGYMKYHVVGNGKGYFLTNGEAIPITWSKASETALTEFVNAETGDPIDLNIGHTYIAIVPSDVWGELVLK